MEDRGRRTEDGGRRMEDGGWRTEDGRGRSLERTGLDQVSSFVTESLIKCSEHSQMEPLQHIHWFFYVYILLSVRLMLILNFAFIVCAHF